MRFLKRHIGRPMDFRFDETTINGRIVKIKRNIATVEYWIQGKPLRSGEAYRTYIDGKRDAHAIVAIY